MVGIFPNDAALIRLAGMLCIEQNDEWLVGRGYFSAESIADVLSPREQHSEDTTSEGGSLNQDMERRLVELQPA